jgi:hypothetical protein
MGDRPGNHRYKVIREISKKFKEKEEIQRKKSNKIKKYKLQLQFF